MIGDFRAEQQALVTASILGSKVGEWPVLAERLEQFGEALASEPPRLDPQEQNLRAALGLRGGHG